MFKKNLDLEIPNCENFPGILSGRTGWDTMQINITIYTNVVLNLRHLKVTKTSFLDLIIY